MYVSHVNSVEDFYVQLSRTVPQLDQLMEDIAAASAGWAADLPTTDLQQGTLCCALFAEDNAWYRAEVTKVLSELEVEVEYFDYGNTSSLLLSDVRVLSDTFFQLPRQAVHCQLNCSREILQSVSKDSFESLVVDKPMTAKCVSKERGHWSVDLQDGGQDIAGILCGDLTSTTVQEKDGVPRKKYLEMPLTTGQSEVVYVSSASDPEEFHVQMSRTSQDLEKLMEQLEKVYVSPEAPVQVAQQLTPGMPCCALFMEDGNWYRAEVTQVLPDSQLEVRFVDYGNSDIVPAQLVKELKPEFLDHPKHSVACKLSVSKTAYSDIKLFQSLDLEKPLQATFTGLEGDKWLVTFEDGEVSANTYPQQKKYPKLSFAAGNSVEMVFLFAESPSSLYLQVTDGADKLDRLMSSIASDLPKDSLLEPTVGLPCLGQFSEDDIWYRAEILAIDGGKAYVQYVDYGNSEWQELARLRPIREEYLDLPVQAVLCCLETAEVVDALKLTDDINMTLAEKALRVEMLRHNDGVYTVQLYEPGSDQPLLHSLLSGEAVQRAPETVTLQHQTTKGYNKPALQLGSHIAMYCITADSPESLHLQFAASESELASLMEQIASVYGALTEGELQLLDPHVGQPCCAQFVEDKQWYRAEVLALSSDGMITVKFVDYGNCDVVPVSKVKKLKDELLDLQVQSVECRLSGICPISSDQKWSDDCLVKLDELCTSKAFSVEVAKVEEDRTWVSLHEDSSSEPISQLLVSQGLAELDLPRESKAHDEQHQYQMPQLNNGDRIHVYCTTASSPQSMQLQLKESHDKLTTLMDDISAVYKTLGSGELQITDPQVGQACCALYSEDEEWYRAQVIHINDGDHLNVKFVDYGNSEIVPLSCVRQLRADFLKLPIQSFDSHLAGVVASSEDGIWSEECLTKVQEICVSEGLVAQIINKTKGSMEVNLFDDSKEDDRSVATSLVDLGFAKFDAPVSTAYSYPKFQVDSEQGFIFVSASSPSSFWCQLGDSESELSSLMGRISEHYVSLSEKDLILQTPDVGTLCCAKFSEDDAWYRAEITQTLEDGTVCVLFVDYGNSENMQVSNVKELAAEFQTLPVQAVECALSSIEPHKYYSEGWSEEAIKKFEELCCDKTLLAKITKVCNRKLEVSLRDINDPDGKAIHEVLMSDAFARGISASVLVATLQDDPESDADQDDIPRFQFMSLTEESKVRVTVSHATSLSHFYCQLVDPDNKLDTLMENIAAHYSFPDLEYLASTVDGQACCAQSIQDAKWYRATVLCTNNSECTVTFVDYGNSETLPLSNIKKLPQEFMALPPQALECAIHGICPTDSDWPKEVASFFKENVAGKELDLVVVNTNKDNTFEVKLFVDEADLSEVIMQEFSETVGPSARRENEDQITDDEEFQDSSEQLSPGVIEKEKELSDEAQDDFQDTRERLSPPEAGQVFEELMREEKEALDEVVATAAEEEKEVGDIKEDMVEERTPAASDAISVEEDNGEEFQEASEVHDVESEEDLTGRGLR